MLHRLYTRMQLAVATDNFSTTRLLGSGGYGAVYSGVLDGIPVAVKVMDTSGNSMQVRVPHTLDPVMPC